VADYQMLADLLVRAGEVEQASRLLQRALKMTVTMKPFHSRLGPVFVCKIASLKLLLP